MLTSLKWLGCLLAGCALTAALASAAPPAADMLKRLPENTNAIVIVQVSEILKTPRAIREGWGKNNQQVEFLAGALPIYPTIDRVVVGSQFDPHNPGHSWYAAIIATNKPVSMEKLAERHQSTVEELAG